MAHLGIFSCLFFAVLCHLANGQFPPRLQIPGAVLLGQPQKQSTIRQRLQQLDGPQPRFRGRPLPSNALPVPVREQVRPVVEEPEEDDQQARQSHFDDEVAKLGITALHTAVQQVDEEPIRERPVPVLRQDIRESPVSRPAPVQPKPLPILRQEAPRPVIRQELKQESLYTRPAPQRQEYEAPVQHVRRPAHQVVRPQQAQPVRQAPAQRPASRPAPQYLDDDEQPRNRKPVVQILRKYRTDNADGSITWGYENEDGSFKEETIGVDCITRGKYGYVDPDGVKREYTYETGGTCEEPEPELDDLPLQQQAIPKGGKKPYRIPAQFN
ncbi:PREDICTED: activating signal cointegrator 1 complex subunit 2 homolog isoform X2 [Nicrophorus vespilloides]|uniref:Activating signal cointegrator 1 complex subunit 2 homolog isoform X2 n=1 Tax=Nicrophorus vespilloides TaxID=110193 RepID=A0ABM1M6J0_NICVS|nr:PREDICTED: activating signal cointegrator 1 complex subunit 2 homolog isoform X2 [Nicrophorus vespilloides]